MASETVSALQTRGVYDKLQDTIQLWPASSKDKYVVNGNPDFTVSAYDNVAAYWGTSHEKAWLAVKNRPFWREHLSGPASIILGSLFLTLILQEALIMVLLILLVFPKMCTTCISLNGQTRMSFIFYRIGIGKLAIV